MVDRDNETWIADLKGQRGRQRQEAAFQDLGNILLARIRWRLSNDTALRLGLSQLDHLAQDTVQDGLVRIWQKGLDLYRGEAKFLTYATAIAINQALEKLRQLRRRREEPWLPGNDAGTDEGEERGLSIAVRSEKVVAELSPEKQVMLREVLQRMDRILIERCSPRERKAFVKKHLDGLKSKEIASLMHATDRAVDLLTFNARKKLRQGLEEEGYTLATLLDLLGT